MQPQTDWTMKQARHDTQVLRQAVALTGLVALLLPGQARPTDPVVSTSDGSAIEREAADSAERHITRSAQCARLEAGNAFLEDELTRLEALGESDSAGAELIRGLARVDAEMRWRLGNVLQENADVLVDGLEGSLAEMGEQEAAARSAWLETRAARIRTELVLFEIRGSGFVAGQLASLLSVDKRWFWLCGMIAVATLLALVCHDRRHELRKLLNGGRPKALGLSKVLAVLLVLLACATAVTFLMGDRIYETLLVVGTGDEESPRRLLGQERTVLEAREGELASTREELERARDALLDTVHGRLVKGLSARNRLPDRWRQLRESLLAARETTAALEVVGEGLRADRAVLTQKAKELQSEEAATRWYLRIRRWIRGLLGVALLGLTIGGGVWYAAGVARRGRATADTCPLCLGNNSLQPDDAVGNESPEVRVVRCRNVISQEPYEECAFSFKDAYRSMAKMCFPTLGIPQAGKTHWLAMLYWSLNQGNYPKTVEFERVRSQTSENFDQIVEEILNTRIGTAATQQDRIPHPL
ncbi:MAG: hypothetical protein GY842_12095, partial [bacterium]|nr:hypothetical protein [bacterium]